MPETPAPAPAKQPLREYLDSHGRTAPARGEEHLAGPHAAPAKPAPTPAPAAAPAPAVSNSKN